MQDINYPIGFTIFKLEEEKFEDCIKLRDLIEEIKKPIKRIPKKKEHGAITERDTDSN